MVIECLKSLDPFGRWISVGEKGTDPVPMNGALLWFDSSQLPDEWHPC